MKVSVFFIVNTAQDQLFKAYFIITTLYKVSCHFVDSINVISLVAI